MNILKLYIIGLLTIVLMSSCFQSTQKLEDSYWEYAKKGNKMDTYLTFAASFPKSERIDSCVIKMDSIIRIKPHISLSSGYYLDTVEKELIVSFLDNNDCDYYLKKRNAFLITVTDSGLYHNQLPITSDQFFKKLEGYYTELRYEDNLPQIKERRNKYFGTILISKVRVVIETDKLNIEEFNNFNWNAYLETIEMVKESYMKLWNEKAKLVWNREFMDLEFDKQEAIMETAIIGMEVNFVKRKFYQGEL